MLKSSVNVDWVLKIHLVPSKMVKIESQNFFNKGHFRNFDGNMAVSQWLLTCFINNVKALKELCESAQSFPPLSTLF